jgi:hypothetical protein
VSVAAGVRPLDGDQTCPSNPTTAYVADLDQPLRDRDVVGERPIRD